ncbi:hypothetical protein [Fusibacter tunisiensis]|uniref:Ubiquinone/menaquinone biosynthesis C-methylase UbiE n=1 Tax=Fusibacter tunisiensis TaxID=1008308 RepID=A0ABS2MTL5_9FIRM|nr:hypothetical protein [Fusibacter tunisiensis]MBM7562783.1 ubiquinone/menaquinone biosynthesis C-methylase UbiE [Fusibacter tunisiensis]
MRDTFKLKIRRWNGSDIFSGHHVLDVGTGTGVLIPELAKRVGSEVDTEELFVLVGET